MANQSEQVTSSTNGTVRFTTWMMVRRGLNGRRVGVFADFETETDYSVFAWRLKSSSLGHDGSPVMFLRDPDTPLPPPTEYRNASFYMFRPRPISSPPPAHDGGSVRSGKSGKRSTKDRNPDDDGVPSFKKEFERFHGENGVRTIVGSIGPVNNGECMACAAVPTEGP